MVSMSLRAWPADFPEDIAVQRRVPYESRADSVLYCQVLAELAHEHGWAVHLYDAKDVEAEAAASWVSERTKCFTVREQLWVHRGRRTIGWRSLQRSWPPDPAPVVRWPRLDPHPPLRHTSPRRGIPRPTRWS